VSTQQTGEPEIRWNLKLLKSLYDEFDGACKELGVSKASVVRMLIGEWLAGLKNGASRSWVPSRTLPPERRVPRRQ